MSTNKDQMFIRADLAEVGGDMSVTTFYRLDGNFRDFLNKILEKHGDIQAVILEKREDSKYGFNIGFVIPAPKVAKMPPLHEEGEEVLPTVTA